MNNTLKLLYCILPVGQSRSLQDSDSTGDPSHGRPPNISIFIDLVFATVPSPQVVEHSSYIHAVHVQSTKKIF